MLAKKPHCLIKLHSFAPPSPTARTESLISIFGMRLDPPSPRASGHSLLRRRSCFELFIGYD